MERRMIDGRSPTGVERHLMHDSGAADACGLPRVHTDLVVPIDQQLGRQPVSTWSTT